MIDELAALMAGRVRFAKLNVDENMNVPAKFSIRGIPTLLVFKGGQVREQIVGYVSREKIEEALDKNL